MFAMVHRIHLEVILARAVAGGSGVSHLAAGFRLRGVRCRQGRGGGSHGIGERATRIEAAAILFADLEGLRGNSLVSNGLNVNSLLA